LPEAPGGDDIFEDVDGEDEELVDLTYEGIAHVNGVRHFVCEGDSAMLFSKTRVDIVAGFKIRQIPEPFIVKRSLLHLFRMSLTPSPY